MANFEYWVDRATGSNANNGSQGAPWLTIRYATTTGLPATAMTSADTVTINLVTGSTYDNVDDVIRLEATEWAGGNLIVRPVSGTAVISPTGGGVFIQMVGAADCALTVTGIDSTCTQIVGWAGLTVTSQTGLRLTIDEPCTFTHVNTTAIDCFDYDSDAKRSSIAINGAVEIDGWACPFDCNGPLLSLAIDGAIFDAGTCLGGRTSLVNSPSISIANASFNWPTSNNTIFQLMPTNGTVTVDNCEFDITTSNSVTAIQFMAPAAGATGTVIVTDSTFNGDTGAPTVLFGNNITDSSTRAANNATAGTLSITVTDCDFANDNVDGGCMRAMIGTDGAVFRGCYAKAFTLGDTTNVHQFYIWGDGIRVEKCYLQTSVLMFGPNQVFRNNVVVADRCVLLGGTQGGSTTSGGGNNYKISGNVLVAFDDDCYSDYAFNGAYPTNLGELVADINRNKYVVLSGAAGIATLTVGSEVPATLAALQEVWTDGWGASSNEVNDSRSELIAGAEKDFIASVAIGSAELTRDQLRAIGKIAWDEKRLVGPVFGPVICDVIT